MCSTVILISESWLNDTNSDMFSITGYKHEYLYRENRKGGGVSLFIQNNLAYKTREDLNLIKKNIETVFIEVDKDQIVLSRNAIIGLVYRPPNTDINTFNNITNTILTLSQSENKTAYLIGDFNINLLNVNKHAPTAEFIELLYTYSYFPLINKPTRVNKNTATFIGHIYTNSKNNTGILSGILYTDISDHFPIFAVFKNKIYEPVQSKCRIFNKRNMDSFIFKLTEIDWAPITQNNVCMDTYTMFHFIFIKEYDKCFLLKVVKVNYRTKKPWLSPALKIYIKK